MLILVEGIQEQILSRDQVTAGFVHFLLILIKLSMIKPDENPEIKPDANQLYRSSADKTTSST